MRAVVRKHEPVFIFFVDGLGSKKRTTLNTCIHKAALSRRKVIKDTWNVT